MKREAGTGEQDIRTGPQIRAFLCAGVRAEGPLVAGLPGARAEGEPGGPREKSATAGSASSCRRRYPCLLYLPCRPCRPPARHQSRHQARQSKSGARRHQAQKRGGTTTPRAQCGREKGEGDATRRGKWPAWRDCPRAPRLRGGARTSPAIARSSNLAGLRSKNLKERKKGVKTKNPVGILDLADEKFQVDNEATLRDTCGSNFST